MATTADIIQNLFEYDIIPALEASESHPGIRIKSTTINDKSGVLKITTSLGKFKITIEEVS